MAYVVLEAGPHTLEGGARLIAGEETLALNEPAQVQFEHYVRVDASGNAFDRVPTVVGTLQSGLLPQYAPRVKLL